MQRGGIGPRLWWTRLRTQLSSLAKKRGVGRRWRHAIPCTRLHWVPHNPYDFPLKELKPCCFPSVMRVQVLRELQVELQRSGRSRSGCAKPMVRALFRSSVWQHWASPPSMQVVGDIYIYRIWNAARTYPELGCYGN